MSSLLLSAFLKYEDFVLFWLISKMSFDSFENNESIWSEWVHFFVFVLGDELLKISFFNDQGLHAVVASKRPLRSCRCQSSVTFLLIVFENRTESRVIQTVPSHTFNHGLDIKSQLKLPLDSLNKSRFTHSSRLIHMPSKSNKGINYLIKNKFTVLVFLCNITLIVVLSLLFELCSIVEQYVHVQHSRLFLSDVFIDLITSLVVEVVNGCCRFK